MLTSGPWPSPTSRLPASCLQEFTLLPFRKSRTRSDVDRHADPSLELARSFQMFTSIVIDGSFVTNEPDPSDVDVVLIFPALQLKRLMSHSDYLKLANTTVRELFAIDLFIDPDLAL